MTTTPARRLAAALLTTAFVAAAVAASGSAAPARGSAGPIKIGISLSLSGDFSDSGKAAQRGYKLWQKVVNAHGGLLGRQVSLIVQDDTSSPTQAATNYQNFITKDKVDLVFGPFSTLLTAPSASVANRYGYAFIEPAGGGPAVFDEKLQRLLHAAGTGDPVGRRLREVHRDAAEIAATDDGGVPVARRPVRVADRRPRARDPREARRQDRLQDDLPLRDDGHDADHPEGRLEAS